MDKATMIIIIIMIGEPEVWNTLKCSAAGPSEQLQKLNDPKQAWPLDEQ